MTSGLINYIDQDADFDEWNNKIQCGIPLPFFKQNHFRQECEYRVLLERDVYTEERDFNRIHNIFRNLEGYDIILHPSSWHDEFLALGDIIPTQKKIRLNLSKIRFNK